MINYKDWGIGLWVAILVGTPAVLVVSLGMLYNAVTGVICGGL